ncbi:MAG: hypothetical protein JSU86_07315, partial [Phycisphaerales bacterium]
YTVGPTTAATATATLTFDPSSIAATTDWPDIPVGINQSQITVTWDPPECEGTLEIVQLEPQQAGGYLPADEGTLSPDPDNDNLWHYTAFDEPQTELCPKEVKVWIGAMQGDTELARKSILVWPVHTFFTTGASADFETDYEYISWKYAAVLATTQGGFYDEDFSTDMQVCCPWPSCNAYACTTVTDDGFLVVFGTATFTGTENQAASIIGHELLHTTGANDCAAYTWEFNHDTGTGIFQCDTSYLANVVQMMNCKCSGINCP